MNRKIHWEQVYATKRFDAVSWYRDHLDTSLKMVAETGVAKDAAIIDVGGGSSTLVDDLLSAGYSDVSVLDISAEAIAVSRERLEDRSLNVKWIAADITEADLAEDRYDVWHDRAVFHFLVDAEDRRKYIALAIRSVKSGGHLIVASFAPDGPQKCSGLDVVRYSAESMLEEFGDGVRLVSSMKEMHNTPFETTQSFVYCHFLKS